MLILRRLALVLRAFFKAGVKPIWGRNPPRKKSKRAQLQMQVDLVLGMLLSCQLWFRLTTHGPVGLSVE